MYLSLIILPLLGSIISGFFGRKVGVRGAQLITCSCVIVTTVLSLVAFFEVGLNNIPVSVELFRWIDSESLNVLWGFQFDSLTVSMLIPVLIISSLVHVYSIGYMSHDPHNQRFFSYLSLFTFMMVILVTANNFLLMFVGWEGVGICSYLLVSFWFTRIAANQSSMSAFLTNRVGDCFLTIGIFALLWSFGNIDYSTVFSLAPYVTENTVTIIGICLLIGAMAKSSQVGLHVWLPLAMEGPTPVSALIHAATMVTAGVYLLMRTSPLIEYSSTVLILCLWIGAITTVFSSLIGLFQQDIKKVIAYSTMSQLGMMVIAVGLSSYNIALFHLVNHAFYKGLLFLGAGAVIHAWADNQDFRKYGGLRVFLPLTYTVMLIASLSLVAFPFMTGFYSKDFILESAYGHYSFSSIVVYFIATIGAMFTTLYSVKVLYLTFLSNPNGPLINYSKAHEGDIFMSIPLIILAIFSIFFGYITKDIFIGIGSSFFSDNSLFIHPSHEVMLDTEFAVPTLFKLLPLALTILLTIVSLILSEYLPIRLLYFKYSTLGYNLFSFFNQRFLIELLYNKYITGVIFKLGGQTTRVLDKGSVEVIGPFGLEKVFLNLSRNVAKLDTGVITSYALYILIALLFYILISFFSLLNSNILPLIILALYVNLADFNTKPNITINKGFIIYTSSSWVAAIAILLFSGMLSITGIEAGACSSFETVRLFDAYINGQISSIFYSVPFAYISDSVKGKVELLISVSNNSVLINSFKSITSLIPQEPSGNSTIVYMDTVIGSFIFESFNYGSLIVNNMVSVPIYSITDTFISSWAYLSDVFINILESDKDLMHLFNIFLLDTLALIPNIFITIFCNTLFGDIKGTYYAVQPIVFLNEVIGDWWMYIQSWGIDNMHNTSGTAVTLGLNLPNLPFVVAILGVENLLHLYHFVIIEDTYIIGLRELTCINALLYYWFLL